MALTPILCGIYLKATQLHNSGSRSSLISRHITNWVFTLCCSSCLSAVVAYVVLDVCCRKVWLWELLVLFEKLPVYFVADV